MEPGVHQAADDSTGLWGLQPTPPAAESDRPRAGKGLGATGRPVQAARCTPNR